MNTTSTVTTQLLKTRGRLSQINAGGDNQRPYILYVPDSCHANSPVLIAVHGIRCDALEIVQGFEPLAERMGCVVVAPVFSRDIYFDYMRLACDGRGLRPDIALAAILEEIPAKTGVSVNRCHMFGFSGGAQFVHRYMMAWPDRVARAVLASPGWFTFPDLGTRFPQGLQPTDTLPDLHFALPELLSVPVSVMVGELDVMRDETFMKRKSLDHQQGVNRVERAQRWVRHMRSAALAHNLDTGYEFQLLPRSGHSFNQCMSNGHMGKQVFEYFFNDQPR